MTDKDERDIASYWGAPCSISFDGEQWEHDREITAHTLDLMRSFEGIKIHLRPISSLTDEEVEVCMGLAEMSAPYKGRRSYDGGVYWGDFNLDATGNVYQSWWNTDARAIIENTPAIYAYLQSIGVYVPGTIDEQYVQLTEPAPANPT